MALLAPLSTRIMGSKNYTWKN